MSTEAKKTPQTAVWYFVGATFAFALGPTLFSSGDPTGWQTILFMILGAVLFVCGCAVFAKELRLRREAKRQASLHPGAPDQPRDPANPVK